VKPLRPLALIAVLVSFAAGTLAGATPPVAPATRAHGRVELWLTSPQADQSVAPATEIRWSVHATVSRQNNGGLALFSFDLVQDEGNPTSIHLPPGDPATGEMEAFDRPAGFTNPVEDPWGSGYGGAPVFEDGLKNLIQIGGAQNTFGVAPPCLGPDADVCMGQNTGVVRGVGQSDGGVMLATGSFQAPSIPGTYVLRIRSAVANTLQQPSASTRLMVRPTPVILTDGGEFSFTVR